MSECTYKQNHVAFYKKVYVLMFGSQFLLTIKRFLLRSKGVFGLFMFVGISTTSIRKQL